MENLLGKKVKYVRLNEKDEVENGQGIVHSVFIGPDKRTQVRVHDGLREDGKPRVLNIDLIAINASIKGARHYIDHVKKIREIADKANAEIRKISDSANAEIEVLNTAYLGEPHAAA